MSPYTVTDTSRRLIGMKRRGSIGTRGRVILSISILLFGVSYLLELSRISTRGYDIARLEREEKNLENENQRVEAQIAAYRSMASIDERVKGMNLVAADDVEYLNNASMMVARK